MAKYGQPDLVIEVDDTVAGTLTDISADVDTINGADVEAITQQSDAFGDSWVTHLYVGVRRLQPITLEGFYDDAVGSGALILNAPGEVRSVKLTWGGSKTTSFEAIISKFNRTPARNELTRYMAELSPTGPVVEV